MYTDHADGYAPTALPQVYQYSLPMFLELFRKALNARQLANAAPAERTRLLSPLLQQLVFGSVSRSLFKKDRLTYAMHLLHLLHGKLFGENEWELFTGQILVAGGGGVTPPRWAHADRAPAFAALAQALPQLANLPFSDPQWERWAKSDKCELEFPSNLPGTTTAFQKILLVQALRPERLQSALLVFVTQALSIPSLTPASSALGEVFAQDSTPTIPILMITTVGADPTQELEEFAAREKPGQYKQLALGGQTMKDAVRLLHEAAKSGGWLCLKNLHIVLHWVPTLEKELSSLTPHPDFRLWLTTEAHPAFPTILLQQSLKITFEAPPGLQKNLQRTYESMMHKDFVERGPTSRAQLLFVLSWFHAVLQERRTYIPQGWTKFYEFSPADLRSAADICDAAPNHSNGQPDWVTIHGLLGSAVYGGRVDNAQDERLLHTYLQQYFSAAMLSPGSGRGGNIRLAPGVSLPASNVHADYLQLISQIPAQDSPQLFGLPLNSDVAVQQRSAIYVQQSLSQLGTDPDTGSNFDRDKWAAQLTPILTLWSQLSQQCDAVKQAQPPRVNAASGAPVETIIALEIAKAKLLLKVVDEAAGAIGRVVRGTELLDATTKAQGNALVQGSVPAAWSDVWEGPEAPVAWMKAAAHRIVALGRWQQAAASGNLLSMPLCLNELLSPSFFLTALRQQTARQARVPMDSLRLSCALEPQLLQAASLRVQVDALLLQGAACAPPQGLSPLPPDAPIFEQMPPLHVAWVPKDAPEPYAIDRSAQLPLYLDPEREVELAQLRLPCSGTEASWLQAGAALFLSGGEL